MSDDTVVVEKATEQTQEPTAIEPPPIKRSAHVSAREFKRALGTVSFAMADNDILYYLNGLCLDCADGRLSVVACDGHRLAVTRMEARWKGDDYTAILPRIVAEVLPKAISTKKPLIEIVFESDIHCVAFNLDGAQIAFREVDGKYPNWRKVIAPTPKTTVRINRTVLLRAAKSVAGYSQKNSGVTMTLAQDSLKIACNRPDGRTLTDEMPILYRGEPIDLSVSFNHEYLETGLAALPFHMVNLGFDDDAKPVLITTDEDPEFRYVIMPMRLRP